jgi:hypothetical protein
VAAEFDAILTDELDDLYWLIEADPEPNWRETYPIWELARYGDTPSHVAWRYAGDRLHSLLYFIDHEHRETIIRWASVVRYDPKVPEA